MLKRFIWIVLVVGLAGVAVFLLRSRAGGDGLTRLMTQGNGYLEQGDATNAIATYGQAVKIAPDNLDARLNLANAYLLAGDSSNVVEECRQALSLDPNSAAAFYVMGCGYLRANEAEPAVQAFQQCEQIDNAVSALHFQLGLAQARLGHVDEAINQFETILQFEPEHSSAHYQLSLLYSRAGRTEEAAREMKEHQEILTKHPNAQSGPAVYERCKFTRPRMAFVLEQPDRHGVPVRFTDATEAVFGEAAGFHGPMAVLDYNHDGRNNLFAMEGQKGFRVLDNRGGHFKPLAQLLVGKEGVTYRKCLVGDLDNDRFEDVLALGEQASQVFKFATNGQARDYTAYTGLKNLQGRDGLLADLDFTGKLDVLAVRPDGGGLAVYQNLGNFYFKENTAASGLPGTFAGAERVAVEDWNDVDVPGVFVTRAGHRPAFFPKLRAGTFVATNEPADWPVGTVLATGDVNNDLRNDLVVAGEGEAWIVFGGMTERVALPLRGLEVKGILLTDYDNDGWLDVVAWGNGLRVWRNLGRGGFADVTAALGLDKIGAVDALVAADFDGDGDTDLIVSTAGGLRFLRNDGGNANRQLKLRLAGNRSNASALGVRLELAAGNWRALRTVQELPVEIGVGQHDKLDALKTRWFDLTSTLVDVAVPTNALTLDELTLPSGSCPYLYAWDGRRFKFVTDMLGGAPLGLPVSKSRYVEADPEEFLELGGEGQFQPKDGAYQIRITEELREVLYLDEARLVAVDHPEGTLVFPTGKLRPGGPFPPAGIETLRPVAALRRGTRSDGLDVTESLARTDGQMVSPVRLREPQLRGLAEPFSVTMDFGKLPTDRPLVLALNGWLRFGGGMANVAASLDSGLPFPFPTLEAELADGSWRKVETDAGAPAGKTKTILIDLEGKLPRGARRLRLTTAFEIYWDSALLCEKAGAERNRETVLAAERTDLHWRGFSEFTPLPSWMPLTPDYDRVRSDPPWRRTPSGWCTRYGAVDELVRNEDDALVLMNGGDELSLSFPAGQLPAVRPGFVRDFFLHAVGWDKDADFHVGQGWRVEPLPFHGMDDQAYDRLQRPAGYDESWISHYNTRWVGPMVLSKRQR